MLPGLQRGTSQTASKSHATLVFGQNMPGTSCHLPLSCPCCVGPIQRHRRLRPPAPFPSTDAVPLSSSLSDVQSSTPSGIYCPCPLVRVLAFLMVSPSHNQVTVAFPQPQQPRAVTPPCYSLLPGRRTSSPLLPSVPPLPLYLGLSPPQSPPLPAQVLCIDPCSNQLLLLDPWVMSANPCLEAMSIGALRPKWLRDARRAGLPPPSRLFVMLAMLVVYQP